ncbi:GH25 family lysozyme [Faecalibacillus intestinalis]|uniref:GH25 family lysozyme n=1 Tax=Faecalibacillus intestinalis TaxID=1982626 RepID=UPI0039A01FFE
MAEIKGIDVSRWNGKIDWKTVANYGMGFAILRITEKGNIVDSTFESNYKDCIENKIPVGVYKYSYATTIAQIEDEANVVIKTLNKRKLDYPVFLDIEDKCQENLSDSLMMKMIEAFRAIIIKAGYKFGIYCGYSWYQYQLPEGAKKYDCWVARYPNNDTGELQERLRVPASTGVIGWQYSSKATIPGIPTKTDRSVFYKDYSKSSTTSTDSPKPTTTQGSDTMNKDKAIDALIVTAQAEIGYMEKQSNAQLDDKNTNVGDGNYTKYWRDLKPIYQGQPWCAVFVSWIMYKTFGLETAKKLLKHENDFPYVYCPTLGARFTKYANPQRGDIVIFYRNGTFAHTGIVTKVEGDKFYTIEGNTSNGSTIIANGGEVCSKHYNNSNLPGTKFCRPDYSIVKSIMNSSSTSKPSQTTYNKWVGAATKNGTDVFTNSTGTSKLSTYPKLNKGNLVDVIGVSGTRYQVKIADKFVGYVEKTNIKDPNAVVTKPSASTSKPAKKGYNKSEKWKGVIIAKSGLKVRKSPGTSNADLECSFSPLKYNTPVSVCDSTTGSDGNKWYYICYKGKYGFSSAKYIKKK